jgi:hypothetical protein
MVKLGYECSAGKQTFLVGKKCTFEHVLGLLTYGYKKDGNCRLL